MRIRYVVGTVWLATSLCTPLRAQTYEKMWKEVDALGTVKDLPQSALAETRKIYEKAKAERNVPQMMKAYLTAMKYRFDIAPDSIERDIEELEQWARQVIDAADKAVLYSILSELTIDKDLRKGFTYCASSLNEKEKLLTVPAEMYEPLVETGVTSRRYFHNNLYDLLARRAIGLWQQSETAAAQVANQTEKLPPGANNIRSFINCPIVSVSDCDCRAAILQTYQSLLKAYDTEENRSAWLLTGIDALGYLAETYPSVFTNEQCHAAFRAWTEQYATVATVPEVYRAWTESWKFPDRQMERLQIVRKGISNYPQYEGVNRLKNIENEILNPALSLRVGTVYPGKEGKLEVTYKNLSGLSLQIYKVNLPVTSALLQNKDGKMESMHATRQHEKHFSLKPTKDYLQTDTVLTFQIQQPGIYYLKAIPDGNAKAAKGVLLHATALKSLHRPLPDGTLEVVVVDALSGQPVSNAELVTYTSTNGDYQPDTVYPTDDTGTVQFDFPKERNVLYNVRTETDAAMKITNLWKSNYTYTDTGQPVETVRLFTDRTLYRPGQVVQVSGLAYTMQGDSVQVLAERDYTVSLCDANHNETNQITVRTDEFGAFSGQFTLPSPCLTGIFSLKAGNISTNIRVEEYKRPTFDVTFEPVDESYQTGDSLCLVGMAQTFAGAAVRKAEVHYRITRSTSGVWRYAAHRTAFWEGETITDAEGFFQISIRLESSLGRESVAPWYETYTVMADVTDGAGETQQGSLSLPLGSTSVVLEIKGVPEKWMKGTQTDLRFTATNLFGQPVNTPIAYQVMQTYMRTDGQTEEGKPVWEGTISANQKVAAEAIHSLPSGSYRLKISATDTQGRKCTASQDFILFSAKDSRPPVTTTDWFYTDGTEFPATLYIGSSDTNVYLFYDVFAGKKRLNSKRITLSDSILSFHFPYREEYGDGVWVSFAFVKGGQLYEHHARITKPEPDKVLQLKWISFRDKLRPGQEEEWRLSVSRPDGSPANAQLLTTLYDASLDKLYRAHSLSFRLAFSRAVPVTNWSTTSAAVSYLHVNFPLKQLDYPPLVYSRLPIPILGRRKMYRNDVLFSRNTRTVNVRTATDAMTTVEEAEEETATQDLSIVDTEEATITGSIPLRENFAETAFFYPHLRTDETGEASISFVLPESFSQWRFLGLAHTKDVDYGTIEATVTTSKEFMVRPNLPRFVRVGDQTHITASLINLSEQVVRGIIRMELFHPETGKVIYTVHQPFAVEAAATEQANFSFTIEETENVLACRVVAEGDAYSDGEQQYLPVLTDKQWMTETVPLAVNDADTHVFPLDNLFNRQSPTASDKRLTVEFTSNPAWYAVLALPVVAEPRNEDALSWAAAYYTTALAAYLVQSEPRIEQVLGSRMVQNDTKDTFIGNLQKNPELKEILLEETPWFTEGADETEQWRRIVALFDRNTLNSRLNGVVDKLVALQQADGAWSWYKGMSGNRYITTHIVKMLARLSVTAGTNSRIKEAYRKGMQYLAQEVEAAYRRRVEAEEKGTVLPGLSEQTLDYLYICALDDNATANKEINNRLIEKLAESAPHLSVYGKALGAIVLYRAGKTKQANAFLQSLLEYSVATPEMGRYFDTTKVPYSGFSYQIPTEVAAMEAIRLLSEDTSTLEEMKRWLLKQKQVQTWDTPVATVDAVYALLAPGSSDLLADTGSTTLILGKEVIETPAGDAIGYIKQTLDDEVEGIRQVTVRKASAGMGWGAVYAQFWEDLDRIDGQNQGLSITRQLRKGNEVVDESTTVQVGDRLTVRLTVEADRNFDFVQITDSRAACMEPLENLSGYRFNNDTGYYQVTKDASTHFFLERMPKGTHILEYEVYITHPGTYQAGIASAQSVYAAEFGGHTAGYRFTVE